MQSAPVAPTMVANPGPTTNPAAGENIFESQFCKIIQYSSELRLHIFARNPSFLCQKVLVSYTVECWIL